MADRGIIFSAPMVRALLDGRKSQTRRLIKPQPLGVKSVREVAKNATNGRPVFNFYDLEGVPIYAMPSRHGFEGEYEAPYAPADRLYVREAWHAARCLDSTPPREIPRVADIEHAATARSYSEIGLKGKLRPGMFLPRWASRLTLTVTDVRVQRLQEISDDDAIAEGIDSWGPECFDDDGFLSARVGFQKLWNTLHTKTGERWEDDPWIVAISFDCRHGNIDEQRA